MIRFILLSAMFISGMAWCQVNPAKRDSLARVITLNQKLVKSSQDSFIRAQESTYHSAAIILQDSINHYTSSLAEGKQIARRNERQIYILIGITAFLLVLLVIGLFRFRKKRKRY